MLEKLEDIDSRLNFMQDAIDTYPHVLKALRSRLREVEHLLIKIDATVSDLAAYINSFNELVRCLPNPIWVVDDPTAPKYNKTEVTCTSGFTTPDFFVKATGGDCPMRPEGHG